MAADDVASPAGANCSIWIHRGLTIRSGADILDIERHDWVTKTVNGVTNAIDECAYIRLRLLSKRIILLTPLSQCVSRQLAYIHLRNRCGQNLPFQFRVHQNRPN